LKQEDGGFRVCVGGEEDVRYELYIRLNGPSLNMSDHRGAYCAMTIIALLNIPLTLHNTAPTRAHGLTSLAQGLPEYLSRCRCDMTILCLGWLMFYIRSDI